MLHSGTMSLLGSILEQHQLTTIVDIGITALLIYWLFSLIRGTRAVRLVIGVSVLVVVYALAVAFDLRLLTQILAGRRRRRPVRPRRHLPARAAPGARADRPGRLVRLAPVAGRIARRRARRRRGRARRGRALRGRPGRAHRARARDRAGGGRGDRGDDPRRRLVGPAADDLHPEVAPPRWGGDHPRRTDRGGRGAPAAGRDLHPHRTVRDAPSGRPGHHRADRRGGRRRLRGERPDQPRRARTDRAQPDRGRTRARDPGPARSGRRPARRVRLAIGQSAARLRGPVAEAARARPVRRAPAGSQRLAGDGHRAEPGDAGRSRPDAGSGDPTRWGRTAAPIPTTSSPTPPTPVTPSVPTTPAAHDEDEVVSPMAARAPR